MIGLYSLGLRTFFQTLYLQKSKSGDKSTKILVQKFYVEKQFFTSFNSNI